MTRLILIRHGQTDYNLKKRYCGISDIGINNNGKAQARRTKNKLTGLRIDKVFCSDLKRSWQTGKIIFGNKHAITKNYALREINFGRWEGLNFKQILKTCPHIYKKWLKNPFSVDIPRGEKMIYFVNRIRRTVKSIIKANPDKTIAIIGHLGPMRVILNTNQNAKNRDFWKIKFKPKAVYIIDYKKPVMSNIRCI